MDFSDNILPTLQRIPWFNELTPLALGHLSKIATLRHLDTDEILFNEGDAVNCIYVLLTGEVGIVTHAPGFGEVQIFTAQPLDVIGWSTLTPVVRQHTDTATARCPCTLVSFNNEMLRQLCDDDIQTGYVIMRRIANVAASRVLITRLHMFEVIRKQNDHIHKMECDKHD